MTTAPMNLSAHIDEDALALLLSGLTVADPIVSAEAARLLGELALPETVAPLVDYVTRCPYYSKTAGILALARIGDRSACAPLRALLRNPGVYDDFYWHGAAFIRLSAALAVLGLDPALDEDLGAGLLRDDDWRTTCFCQYFSSIILRLPDASEIAIRLKERTTVLLYDASLWQPDRLTMISQGLGTLGGAQAAVRLRSMFMHPSRYVRAEAAFHLLQAHPVAASAEAVVRLQEHDPMEHVRLASAAALVGYGRLEYGACLRQAIVGQSDPFERAVAIELAGKVRLADAASSIRAQCGHPDAYVRICAIEALDRLGDATLLGRMGQLLADHDPRVRMQAAAYAIAAGLQETA